MVRSLLARGAVLPAAVLPASTRGALRIDCVDGLVQRIEPTAGVMADSDALVLPGFVDLQVNGGGGRDVAEATADALDAVAEATWAGGATHFLPTLITAPLPELLERVAKVAAWIETWRGRGAEPLGIHLEGPFLEVPGAHDAGALVDPTPERVDALVRAARGRLALVTLAPGRAGAPAATARLRRAGVAVALGHARSTDGLSACVDAGARLVTHLFNAMGPLHHREPGLAGLALDEGRLACSLICDGVHVHPAMVRNAFAVLGPTRTVLVSDAVAASGQPDGAYTLGGRAVEARQGVVRRADGTLAGSALTMALAAQRFQAFLGPRCGPWTVAQVASRNAARLLGRDDLGEIRPGAPACFTLWADDACTAWRA